MQFFIAIAAHLSGMWLTYVLRFLGMTKKAEFEKVKKGQSGRKQSERLEVIKKVKKAQKFVMC